MFSTLKEQINMRVTAKFCLQTGMDQSILTRHFGGLFKYLLADQN